MTPEITDFPISAMLDEISASLCPGPTAKGLGWQVKSCTDGVRSDMTLLGRVLRNLVENAIRYTRVRAHPDHLPHGSRTVCALRSRIPASAFLPSNSTPIFEEFHQVGNQARDRTSGSWSRPGDRPTHRGSAGPPDRTRSRLGEGSIFSIELPLVMTEAAEAAGSRDAGFDQNGPRAVGRGDRR